MFWITKFLVISLQQQWETHTHADERFVNAGFFFQILQEDYLITYDFIPNATGELLDYVYNFFHMWKWQNNQWF